MDFVALSQPMKEWMKNTFKVPSRYSHLAYGVIQSGLTCSIAASIASISFLDKGYFIQHWLKSWGISWLSMLPVVVLTAPLIRRLVSCITTQPQSGSKP
jgi:hypothetical protein